MTNMTPVSSVIGASKTTTTSVLQVSFEEALVDKLSLELEKSAIDQLKPLVAKLPAIENLNETENAEKYASALIQLVKKQEAISGTFSVDVVNDWVKAIPATNGLVEANDVINKVNATLANHFRSWFESKLEDSVSPGLPSGFISNFRLGAESTQAQQIAGLTADKLNEKTQEIKGFLQDLGASFRLQRADENAAKFLSSAFESLGNGASLNINQMRQADFSLTKARFQSALETALNESLKGIGTFEVSDIQSLAEKITWVPGVTQKQLTDVISKLSQQVKQQFNDYPPSTELVGSLQSAFDKAMKELKDSSATLNITSLFSFVASFVVEGQISSLRTDKKINSLQLKQISEEQYKKIINEAKRDTVALFDKDLKVLFHNVLSKGTKDLALEFPKRFSEMRNDLAYLSTRLKQITIEELQPEKNANGTIKLENGQPVYNIERQHQLTAKDLLSVIKANIGGEMDERVLLAFEQRRLNRLAKRDEHKEQLEALTAQLKIFGAIQSQIQEVQKKGSKPGESGVYKPKELFLNHESFKMSENDYEKSAIYRELANVYRENKGLDFPRVEVKAEHLDQEAIKKAGKAGITIKGEDFILSPSNIAKYIKEDKRESIHELVSYKTITPPLDGKYFIGGLARADLTLSPKYIERYIKPEYRHPNGGIIPDKEDIKLTHVDFLTNKINNFDTAVTYQDTKDSQKLSNLSNQLSETTKLVNTDVQLKTTDLNDTNSQYLNTIEAMNKFIQKYMNIIETILRAI